MNDYYFNLIKKRGKCIKINMYEFLFKWNRFFFFKVVVERINEIENFIYGML